MRTAAALVFASLACACAAQERPLAVAVPSASAPALAAPPAGALAQAVQPTPVPPVPANYVKVEVAAVVPEGQGAAVVLDPGGPLVVEVHVGGSEALAIQHRFEHTSYVRPLTHDLMDSVMKQTGVEVVRAQVDKLENGTFIGTLVVRQRGQLHELDARPSDAIALAMGAGAPIYCASSVVKKAGVPRGDAAGMDSD